MPRYSPHQGEFRIGQQRYNYTKKDGWFGSTFTANGVSASSEHALKRKLAERKNPQRGAQAKRSSSPGLLESLFAPPKKAAPKKKPGWFG